jgi:hypothetical protein
MMPVTRSGMLRTAWLMAIRYFRTIMDFSVCIFLHLPYTRLMDNEAEELLRSLAEKQQRNRWPALYLLAIHAHRYPKMISGPMLMASLLAQEIPPSDAAQIAEEFDRYKELLALYDLLREPDRSKAE